MISSHLIAQQYFLLNWEAGSQSRCTGSSEAVLRLTIQAPLLGKRNCQPHQSSPKFQHLTSSVPSLLFFLSKRRSLNMVALPCYKQRFRVTAKSPPLACEKFGVISTLTAVACCLWEDGSTCKGPASIDARNWHQKYQDFGECQV